MPRLDQDSAEMQSHQTGGNFSFTAVRLERLGATEYTLVTIAVDVTGSVERFADGLLLALKNAVQACKKSQRSENLLIRVVVFSSRLGVAEVHGFKPLKEIEPDKDYQPFRPDGMTPLFDAVYDAVSSVVEYGGQLIASDFNCNAIVFIITDGEDNQSTTTVKKIQKATSEAKQKEKLESLHTVIVGINVGGKSERVPGKTIAEALALFKDEAGLDQFIDAGDATPGKLAKLAQFVSHSVSSQSQALGTGGPSQNIAATI